MNKINQYLVPASLAALAFALLGGLWLVWQTIEESRALESHNRELQASLEASRIRVANFCEYPTDVLCRTDERTGLVAGAMSGELAGQPDAGMITMPVPAVDIIPERRVSPAIAVEHLEMTAKAQTKGPAQALTSDEYSRDATPEARNAVPSSKPEVSAPAAISLSSADTSGYRHEITSKLAPELPVPTPVKNDVPDAFEKEEAPAAPPLVKEKKSFEALKKTWSRVDIDGDIYVFTLTGEGQSLPAAGALLSSPLRYELKLTGNWKIGKHRETSHWLVRDISTKSVNGDTIVTFHLKNTPYRCSLHRADDRTISVRIR